MPEPVWREITAGADESEAQAILEHLDFTLVQPDQHLFNAYSLEVDSGEAAALALAATAPPECCLYLHRSDFGNLRPDSSGSTLDAAKPHLDAP